MKNLLLISFALFAFGLASTAQTNVNFNINHKLGTADFALNSTSTNDMGHDFNVTRLEYYISQISIIHDGGIETLVPNLWILVDASNGTTSNVDLGNHDVTDVEGIEFYIGVDASHNHDNPADYAAGHPLAPTSPSMHWGWAAGYRFIAYEGKGGANFDQTFQLHGLGDANYYRSNISVSSTANNGSVSIDLDADYARGLEGIALNSGLIVHGEAGDAKLVIENFRDYVFQASTTSVSTIDISEINSFEAYPNPTTTGITNLLISSSKDLNYEVSVTDILGREIKHFTNVSSNERIELELGNKGLYFISLIKEGKAVLNRKLLFN
ncbi:MAG: hypothetical protein ACI94Y_003675 [Maribacter sp.]|jgi:hypothetical protein